MKTRILLLLTFLAGVLLGAAATMAFRPQRFFFKDGDHHRRMMDRLSSKLELTPEQKTQIQKIMDDKKEKMTALRTEAQTKFEDLRKTTADDIRKALNPDQQTRFSEMEKEWAEKRQKMQQRGWHP